MAIVFLSYRRDDSEDVAGRIYDELIKHFGKDDVFMDVDSIPDGADFVKIIQDQVRECRVVLVVIGRNWIGRLPTKKRRIDDPNDFVRLEVQAALQRGMPVIPLLVSRATMPSSADLPDSLHRLTRLNARTVRPNPEFHHDMDKVIAAIETQAAVWLAAEQEREAQSHRASETALHTQGSQNGASGLDAAITDALIGRAIVSRTGMMSRYVMSAFLQGFRAVLVSAIFVGILAAAATIGVGSWLAHEFPPGLPAYIAAGWSALTTGGMVGAIIGFEEMLRAIIKAVELLIAESEHMAATAAMEVERLGAEAVEEAKRLGATATDAISSPIIRRDASDTSDISDSS